MGKIYLRQPDGSLRSMSEAPFDNEDLLQKLLADYPDLLAGEDMEGSEPRRWVLVARELGVPDEAGAADRWSLDHLFLDQDGVPTLVEVKRSTDTRIRREVVGQMLDYAANAVSYWPPDLLRTAFEEGCGARNLDPAATLAQLLARDADDEGVTTFWEQVKTNLQAGRVRLVFLADRIPPELRSVVEFLNEHMDPTEVLAVEVRQYVGEGLQSLVPRLIGQTIAAQQKKGTGSRAARQWDEASFMAELQRRGGADAVLAARDVLEWSRSVFDRVWWGKGVQDGSMTPSLDLPPFRPAYPFALWTYGRVEVCFTYLADRPFFSDAANRRELLDRLRGVEGIDLPLGCHDRRPSFPIGALAEARTRESFKSVMEWAVAQMRAASGESRD